MAKISSKLLDFGDNPIFSNHEFWPAAFDALASAIVLCQEGVILWANTSALALLGFATHEEACGASLANFLDDRGEGLPGADSSPWIECALRGTSDAARCLRWQRLSSPDWERMQQRALQTCEAARPLALQLWQVEEIGKPKTLQEELRLLQRELEARRQEVQQQRRRLRTDAEQREEFLMVVSHELRTPITVINGYNRLLLQEKVGPLNAEQARFISEISKSCQRLSHFISNLIEASREAFGEITLDRREASLAALVDTVLSFLQPLLDEQALRVKCRIDPEASRAYFDAVRIEQVLTNLIGNAVKYTQRGGAIEIATARFEQAGRPWLEVAISDNGPGVQPEDRERIFEPYTRAGESSRAGGLGLGLAICKRIVEAHGGVIRVATSASHGSRFEFTLPGVDSFMKSIVKTGKQ